MNSLFPNLPDSLSARSRRVARGGFLTLFAAMLLLAGDAAMAQTSGGGVFDLPLIRDFGCALIEWMTGTLAYVVFAIVVIITLVIGIFAKMDWTKILTVVIIFGIIQGLVAGSFKFGVVSKPNVCTSIRVFG